MSHRCPLTTRPQAAGEREPCGACVGRAGLGEAGRCELVSSWTRAEMRALDRVQQTKTLQSWGLHARPGPSSSPRRRVATL